MLFFRRTHRLLGAEVERGFAGIHCPSIRVYVAWMTGGLRFDTSVLGLSPAQATIREGAVSIQLGGDLGVRVDGRELPVRDGEVAAMRVRAWNERWEGPFRVLVVEWSDPSADGLPDFDRGRLTPSDYDYMKRFASELQSGELIGSRAAEAVGVLLARLRAAGLPTPLEASKNLVLPVPPGAQRLAHTLGDSLSQLHTAPQVEDVASQLGLSARQVNRKLAALGEWLPIFSRPGAWRRQLRRQRASLAASFLTRRGVALEQVASSLGYGSARAMLLALSQEGLPPPRVLRAV